MTTRTTILQTIRSHREAAGLTQQEVADKSGLFRNNISSIESGKANVTLDTLIKIAEAMGYKLVIKFKK